MPSSPRRCGWPRDVYITPAIEGSRWDRQTQFREEVPFTDGQVIVRGKLVTRGEKKRADYQKLQAEIAKTRDTLKQELTAALGGKAK